MTDATFDERLVRLTRKHRRMALGVTYRIGRDGLVTAHPRRGAAVPRFPWNGLAMIVAMGLAFKAFLLTSLGEGTYAARLAVLEAGNLTEQAGAWLMQPDSVTATLARLMTALAA